MSMTSENTPRRGFLPPSLHGWFDVVTKLGAALAIVIAYFEYVDKQRESRVERVQQFVVRSQEGPIASQLAEIDARVREHEAALVDLEAGALSDEGAKAARADLVKFLAYESGPDQSGLRTQLDSALNFYDSIEVCVEERLCDEATAQAFFAKPTSRLVRNFSPYIEEQRSFRTDYAAPAQSLASRPDVPPERSPFEAVQDWFKPNAQSPATAPADES